MKEANDNMVALFGANVSQFGGDVQISGADTLGHARRSLVEGKGFENDWYKVYFNDN